MSERKLVSREIELDNWTYEDLTYEEIRNRLNELESKYPNGRIHISTCDWNPEVTLTYEELETQDEYEKRTAREKSDGALEASLKTAKAKLTHDEIAALRRFPFSW